MEKKDTENRGAFIERLDTKKNRKILFNLMAYLNFVDCSKLAGTCKFFFRIIYNSSHKIIDPNTKEIFNPFKNLDMVKINKKIPLSLCLKFISYGYDQLKLISIPYYFNNSDVLK